MVTFDCEPDADEWANEDLLLRDLGQAVFQRRSLLMTPEEHMSQLTQTIRKGAYCFGSVLWSQRGESQAACLRAWQRRPVSCQPAHRFVGITWKPTLASHGWYGKAYAQRMHGCCDHGGGPDLRLPGGPAGPALADVGTKYFAKEEFKQARDAVKELDVAVSKALSFRERAQSMLAEAHRALLRLEQVNMP